MNRSFHLEFLSYFVAFKGDKKAPKRKKLKKTSIETDETPANNDDNESHNIMPAPPPSKRQKKRQKKENIPTRDKDKEIEKTILYLTKWDTNRDEWKYEKLRQIYVQKNIFDDRIIPSKHCDVAIRYLSTSKVTAETLKSYCIMFNNKCQCSRVTLAKS